MKLLYLPAYTYPEKAASEYLGHNMNQAFADSNDCVCSNSNSWSIPRGSGEI